MEIKYNIYYLYILWITYYYIIFSRIYIEYNKRNVNLHALYIT